MLKITRHWLVLALILLLGLSLRLYRLGSYPPGLTWDEAALGYNAFSVLKTARDEHGAFLPLVFKSFGDYKPGLYVYAALPSVAALGLNEFSTRLPSALFGVLALWGIYLLANHLFPRLSPKIGLLAALLLAVSPWHLYFSRGAWEVNVYVTLLVFSLYFLLKALSSSFPLWPSLLLALSTLFTYQGAKLLTPLVIFSVLALNLSAAQKVVSRLWRHKLSPDSLLLLFSVIAVTAYFFANIYGPAGNRLARLSLFSYRPELSAETIAIDDNNPLTLSLFHNLTDQQLHSLISRYLYHFSPEVLFYEGSVISDRGHIPRMGMLYLADAALLLLGLFILAHRRLPSAPLLILLLLVSPLPASMTLSEFSTFRAEFIIIPLTILSALGLHLILRHRLLLPFVLIYLFNIVYGLDLYFNHSATALSKEYNAGYKQVYDLLDRFPARRAIISDIYGQPYIYYLFYNQYPPALYQSQNDFIDGGLDVGRVGTIAHVEFHQFYLYNDELSADTFYAGTRGNIPDNYKYDRPDIEYYEQVNFPDGEPMFRVIKTLNP